MILVKSCKTSKLRSLRANPAARDLWWKKGLGLRNEKQPVAVVTVHLQPGSLPGEAQVLPASLIAAMVSLPFSTLGQRETMVLRPWESVPDPFRWVLRPCCWCSAWKDWGKNGNGWKKYQSTESLGKCFWKDRVPNPVFTNIAKLLQDWACLFYTVTTLLIFCMTELTDLMFIMRKI